MAKKASQVSGIPVKIFKGNLYLIQYYRIYNFNNVLLSSEYLTSFKYVGITPILKRNDKNNPRPRSILPTHSKI